MYIIEEFSCLPCSKYTLSILEPFFFQSYFFDSNFPFSNSGNCLPQKGYSTVPNTDPR